MCFKLNLFWNTNSFVKIMMKLIKSHCTIWNRSYPSVTSVQEAITVLNSKLPYQPCATVRTSVHQDQLLQQKNAPKGITVLLGHGRFVDSTNHTLSFHSCILYISFSFLSSMHELIFITCFFSSPIFSSFLHLRTFIRSSRALLARTKISTDKLNARTAPPVSIVCMPLLRHYLAISALIVRQIRRLERSLSVP